MLILRASVQASRSCTKMRSPRVNLNSRSEMEHSSGIPFPSEWPFVSPLLSELVALADELALELCRCCSPLRLRLCSRGSRSANTERKVRRSVGRTRRGKLVVRLKRAGASGCENTKHQRSRTECDWRNHLVGRWPFGIWKLSRSASGSLWSGSSGTRLAARARASSSRVCCSSASSSSRSFRCDSSSSARSAASRSCACNNKCSYEQVLSPIGDQLIKLYSIRSLIRTYCQ